jgi:HSP20 family protein
MTSKGKGKGDDRAEPGVGGMLKSLGGFLDLLSKFSEENGGEFHRNGEMGNDKKGMKAVYGFSVRLGGAGQGPRVEPFGNVRERSDGPVVEEVREPMIDLFDEGDYVTLVAELPGVDADDVKFTVRDDVLELVATHGDRKYRKEVILPYPVDLKKAGPSYRNGVFELKLPKAGE